MLTLLAIEAALHVFALDGSLPNRFFGSGTFHQIFVRSLLAACLILLVLFARTMVIFRRSEKKFNKQSAAIETSMDGIAIHNNKDEYVYVNQAYALINGYEKPEDLLGKNVSVAYEEQELDRMARTVMPILQKSGKWRGELAARRKNGSSYFQEASVTLLDDGGQVSIIRDITWRKRSEERMQRSERFLNTIFHSIRDPFCIFDNEFRIIRLNHAYAQMKNKDSAKLIGMKCYSVLEGRDQVCDGCVVAKTFQSGDPCAKDKMVTLEDGTAAWVEIYTYPIVDQNGSVSHVMEYTRDITDRKKAEEEKRRLIERLDRLSRTDELTGLLNRRALNDTLSYELERAKRYGSPLALILCDLDNFKEINDSYGHDTGDRALQTISGILKSILRKSDTAGRYGGDEFIIILPEASIKGAESLADKILNEVRNYEFRFDNGKSVHISVSIGVACAGGDQESIDSLVKRADDAMYVSKQGGRNRVSFI